MSAPGKSDVNVESKKTREERLTDLKSRMLQQIKVFESERDKCTKNTENWKTLQGLINFTNALFENNIFDDNQSDRDFNDNEKFVLRKLNEFYAEYKTLSLPSTISIEPQLTSESTPRPRAR